MLRVPLSKDFAPGTVVGWSIPPDQVRLLSNSGRPLSPDDLPVVARLIEVVIVDNIAIVMARSIDTPEVQFRMTADRNVAEGHGVTMGAELTLRLRGRSVRVLPIDEVHQRT